MIGWGSIIAVVRLPIDRWIAPQAVRYAGGAALATLGLVLLGTPLPTWSPLVVLAVGLGTGALRVKECKARSSSKLKK